MDRWMLYALTAFFLWGIWGLLGKLASRTLNHKQLVFYSLAGYLIIFVFVAAKGWGRGGSLSGNPGLWLALATGLCSGVAYLFFYLAISRGEASRIVTITALYPVVTSLLAFLLLGEAITPRKIAGLLMAIGGLVLLSL
jgi:transporter family protein